MNEKKKLTTKETFALALQNHKKNKIAFFARVHRLNFKSIKICKNVGFKFLRKENDFLIFKKS